MALGDTNNNSNNSNNNGKGIYDPTVYSPIMHKNPNASCDPSELSYSYWKNLLKICISPMIDNSNSDTPYPTYDHKNQGVIHLNHDKARMLYNEIKTFLEDPTAYNNMGVSSGSAGLISIGNGKEFGVNSPVLSIRKINPETGTVDSCYTYQFKTDVYSVRNFDDSKQKFDTFEYKNIEIESLLDVLKTFYESMSYATAYSVVNAFRYDTSRLNTKLDLLMESNGIHKSTKSSYNSAAKGSFFSGANKGSSDSIAETSSKKTTIEELSDMIG